MKRCKSVEGEGLQNFEKLSKNYLDFCLAFVMEKKETSIALKKGKAIILPCSGSARSLPERKGSPMG